MKRLFSILAALALGAFALGACGEPDPEEVDPIDLSALINPDGQAMRGLIVESKAMQQNMKYNVRFVRP